MAFPWLMNGGDPNYSQVLWMMVFKSFTIGEVQFSAPKTNMTMATPPWMKMYVLPKRCLKFFFQGCFFKHLCWKSMKTGRNPKGKDQTFQPSIFQGRALAVSFRECKNYSLGNRWMAWVLPQLGFLSERLSASPGIGKGIFLFGNVLMADLNESL